MKPAEKILSYEQARELKWFCKNVTGTREQYYKVYEMAEEFNARLARLEKTCETIENFLGENWKDEPQHFDTDWGHGSRPASPPQGGKDEPML